MIWFWWDVQNLQWLGIQNMHWICRICRKCTGGLYECVEVSGHSDAISNMDDQ